MPHPERSLIQIRGAGKQNSEEVNLGNGDVCLQDVKKKDRERGQTVESLDRFGFFLLHHKSNSAEILLGTLPE